MTQDRFIWQEGDIVITPPSDEKRDWAEWDAEHPYVPHPKELTGGAHVPAIQGSFAKTGEFQRDLSLSQLDPDTAKQCEYRMTNSMGVTPAQAQQNLVDRASTASPEEAEEASHWYENAQKFNQSVAESSGLNEHVVAAITAANSPGQLWESNMRATQLIANASSPEGRAQVLTQDLADKINAKIGAGHDQVTAGQTWGEVMDHDPRAGAIMIGRDAGFQLRTYDNLTKGVQLATSNDPNKIGDIITGAKVRSFFNCMEGSKVDVCSDIHMQRAMVNGNENPGGHDLIRQVEKNETAITGTPGLGGAGLGAYPVMADVVRSAAAQYNQEHGTSYTPAQFQAITWVQQIGAYPRARMKSVLRGAE